MGTWSLNTNNSSNTQFKQGEVMHPKETEVGEMFRPPLVIAPPEEDPSRALVVTHAVNFTPSLIRQIVGGAYDPLTYLVRPHQVKAPIARKKLLLGMGDIMRLAFEIHRPAEVIVITDGDDGEGWFVVVSGLVKKATHLAKLDYIPVITEIHIRECRQGDFKGETFLFPQRKCQRIVCGCIDPRLVRVRVEIEPKYHDVSWFTVPGCINQIGRKGHQWKNLRYWIRQNLRFAKRNLGMRYLKICPHEDCLAHPFASERRSVDSLERALWRRVSDTERAIRRLMNDKTFKGLQVKIVPIALNGRPLAVRLSEPSRKGCPFITLAGAQRAHRS